MINCKHRGPKGGLCQSCRERWKRHRPDGFLSQRRAWLAGKKSKPCLDCGGLFPTVCMDFDHRPDSDKHEDISKMVPRSKYSLEDIENEMAKCDLVCANCHRVRTARRQDWI